MGVQYKKQEGPEDSRFLPLTSYLFLVTPYFFFGPAFAHSGKLRGQTAPAKTTMQK